MQRNFHNIEPKKNKKKITINQLIAPNYDTHLKNQKNKILTKTKTEKRNQLPIAWL